ncbi:MAG: hypothetical protein WDN48_06335 [Pseudolabrys sp.]
MTNIAVTIPQNTLVDRLRTLASDLTGENRHTDALLVDLAIQAIQVRGDAETQRVVAIVDASLRCGKFDVAIDDVFQRRTTCA